MLHSLRHAQPRVALSSQIRTPPFDVYEFREHVVDADGDVAEEREEEEDQREGDDAAAVAVVVEELGGADDEEDDGNEGEHGGQDADERAEGERAGEVEGLESGGWAGLRDRGCDGRGGVGRHGWGRRMDSWKRKMERLYRELQRGLSKRLDFAISERRPVPSSKAQSPFLLLRSLPGVSRAIASIRSVHECPPHGTADVPLPAGRDQNQSTRARGITAVGSDG